MEPGEIDGRLGLYFPCIFLPEFQFGDRGSVIGLSGIREILFPVPVMMNQFSGSILVK